MMAITDIAEREGPAYLISGHSHSNKNLLKQKSAQKVTIIGK